MPPLKSFLWLLVSIVWAPGVVAQKVGTAARDTSVGEMPLDSSWRFIGLPLLFYSQDTRLGFGAAGVITFPGRPLRSSVTFSLAYTLRRQWLVYLPYQWYSRNGAWRAYGEVGWYRYRYQYFGIGNRYPNDFLETYTARFPRLRLTGLRSLPGRHHLGLRYQFDDYEIVEASAGSEIEAGTIPGARGGFSSGLGPAWVYDSRDNPFFPRRGWLAEVALTADAGLTGSDFRFARLAVDAVRYWMVGKKSVVAAQAVGQFTAGDAPFFLLNQLGGTKRLRGYPDGKYRDRHLLLFQGEWRFPLFWRFKGVVFAGAGTVFGQPGESWRWRPNGGGGLRLEVDRKQQVHLRLDYGFGEGHKNSGFYLTFGEAF